MAENQGEPVQGEEALDAQKEPSAERDSRKLPSSGEGEHDGQEVAARMAATWASGPGSVSGEEISGHRSQGMTPTTPALAAMLDVPLEVAVEVGRVALPLGDILALQPGAVVELERVPGEPLDLLVNGHPVAKGEIVVINDTFAFRVTQVIGQSGRSFDYADEAMTGDER